MPRSKPAEESTSSEPGTGTANPSIFGAAKPVDTAQKELEIERKLIKNKDQMEPQKRFSEGKEQKEPQKRYSDNKDQKDPLKK